MKTALTLFLAIFLFTGVRTAIAQAAKEILSQVADGIKPEAFTAKFNKNKSKWTDAVSSLDPGDVSGMKKQLGKLVGGLSPDALEGLSKSDLLGQVKNLTNI